MLLIRGVSKEEHAKLINQGRVSFRDLQSIVYGNNDTGYARSNYYELLFAKTRFGRWNRDSGIYALPFDWRRIVLILADHFMAESYLTYFHIFDPEHSLAWLDENWPDGGYFMYYEPRCEFGESVIGNRYCGQRIRYVDGPSQIDAQQTMLSNPGATVVMMDSELPVSTPTDIKQKYAEEFIESVAPLFNRVKKGRYDQSENEFRMLARSPRKLDNGEIKIVANNPIRIKCAGKLYKPEIIRESDAKAEKQVFSVMFRDAVTMELLLPHDLAKRDSHPTIEWNFLDVDITDTAQRYGFIGNKEACREFFIRLRNKTLDLDYEDENHHVHHGEWIDYLSNKRIQHDKTTILLKPPQAGYYSEFGRGFMEAALPNPQELKLTTPREAFMNGLSHLSQSCLEHGTWSAPMNFSRELLCSTLAPWLPLKLYGVAALSGTLDEQASAIDRGVLLRKPDASNGPIPTEIKANYSAVKNRMSNRITKPSLIATQNAQRKNASDESVVEYLDAEIQRIESMSLTEFEEQKSRFIDSFILRLPNHYRSFRSEIHFARFFETPASCFYESPEESIIAAYEIDPYDLRCSCDDFQECNNYLPASLCPVMCNGQFDFTEYSHVLGYSSLFVPHATESTYLALVSTAMHEDASYHCADEWRLICGTCPDNTRQIYSKLEPSELVVLSGASKEKCEHIKKLGEKLSIPVSWR